MLKTDIYGESRFVSLCALVCAFAGLVYVIHEVIRTESEPAVIQAPPALMTLDEEIARDDSVVDALWHHRMRGDREVTNHEIDSVLSAIINKADARKARIDDAASNAILKRHCGACFDTIIGSNNIQRKREHKHEDHN